MRVMDGLMSIPAILLAIALDGARARPASRPSSSRITVVEIPRVVRLVRSVVLTLREQPYVEAAVAIGTGLPRDPAPPHPARTRWRRCIVQATYICASAILIESILSLPRRRHAAGGAELGQHHGRGPQRYFQLALWIILFPGLFLTLTVLSINLIGDGLRDMLDPRFARRM